MICCIDTFFVRCIRILLTQLIRTGNHFASFTFQIESFHISKYILFKILNKSKNIIRSISFARDFLVIWCLLDAKFLSFDTSINFYLCQHICHIRIGPLINTKYYDAFRWFFFFGNLKGFLILIQKQTKWKPNKSLRKLFPSVLRTRKALLQPMIFLHDIGFESRLKSYQVKVHKEYEKKKNVN